ncbi:MAG: pirin family protein [Zoogloeaceae bacterium]|jgi:redox-sensitive bicupin YhaK (pirin superfamily)|nr:pirin family protein [Zoogloeaceae bacterium]
MLRYIDSKKMGRSDLGWLKSHFHFSFAEYRNPANVQFGVLRVLNDDQVEPGTGFDRHPHKNMEIISYVAEGELTHTDSMGNSATLRRGEVQYMSAGTGVFHGEHNRGQNRLRLLQIWILPDQQGLPPDYGDFRFDGSARENIWLPIAAQVGDSDSSAPVRVHADIHLYVTLLQQDKRLNFKVSEGRQAYLTLIEGEAEVSGIRLFMRDALEIVEEDITLNANAGKDAHALIIEMART